MSVIDEAKQAARNTFILRLAEELKPSHLTIAGWKDTPFYQMTINNLNTLVKSNIIDLDRLIFNKEKS